jgi:CspA family cold shock protein
MVAQLFLQRPETPASVGIAENGATAKKSGTILSLVSEKGFGFVKPDGGGESLFFHASEIAGVEFAELAEGNRVRFSVKTTDRGLQAAGVQLIEVE